MAYRRKSSSGRSSSPERNRKSLPSVNTESSSRYTSSQRGGYPAARRSSQRQRKRKRRWRLKPLPILVIIIVVIILCVSAFSKNAVEIFVDNKSIGYVEGNLKKISVEDLEKTLNSQLNQEIGTEVKINEEITAKSAHASAKEMVTTDTIVSKIKNNVTYKVKAAIVTIEGEEAGVISSLEEVNEFFESYASQYIEEGSNLKNWEFTRDVQAKEAYVEADKIVTTDVIKAIITETKLEPVSYTVEAGDTLYNIASKLGVSYKQLMADNPGLSENLHIGQVLDVLIPTPYVSVRTVEEISASETIPKGVEEQIDDTKARDYKKVLQQGRDGERKVVTEITKVNGVFESETVISDTVVIEPVNDIIVVGRK